MPPCARTASLSSGSAEYESGVHPGSTFLGVVFALLSFAGLWYLTQTFAAYFALSPPSNTKDAYFVVRAVEMVSGVGEWLVWRNGVWDSVAGPSYRLGCRHGGQAPPPTRAQNIGYNGSGGGCIRSAFRAAINCSNSCFADSLQE
jgi:hypothetical protein